MYGLRKMKCIHPLWRPKIHKILLEFIQNFASIIISFQEWKRRFCWQPYSVQQCQLSENIENSTCFAEYGDVYHLKGGVDKLECTVLFFRSLFGSLNVRTQFGTKTRRISYRMYFLRLGDRYGMENTKRVVNEYGEMSVTCVSANGKNIISFKSCFNYFPTIETRREYGSVGLSDECHFKMVNIEGKFNLKK